MLKKQDYEKFVSPNGKDLKDIRTRNKEKIESTIMITDGSGRGVREGLKFRIWPEKFVADATCVNFSEFNGNEFAQLLVEDVDTGKLIAITASKLNLHIQEVDDDGKDIQGSILEAGGELAKAWRSPGGRATLKDRMLACNKAVDDADEDIDYFVIHVDDKKCRPYPSDRDEGKKFSTVQVCTFVGCTADGEEVW